MSTPPNVVTGLGWPAFPFVWEMWERTRRVAHPFPSSTNQQVGAPSFPMVWERVGVDDVHTSECRNWAGWPAFPFVWRNLGSAPADFV